MLSGFQFLAIDLLSDALNESGYKVIKNVVQLNSVDGDVYQSLLLKPSLGQFGLSKLVD